MSDAMHPTGAAARDGAFAASRFERDRTLEAMRRLESALAMAAGGEGWRSDVADALALLEQAMSDERGELHRPDALLALIAAEHPRRFGSHVRYVREQYDDLIRQVESLRRELDDPQHGVHDAGDVRHRAGWIMRGLHHCRARQTDLVYDALRLDLGGEEPGA